MNGEGIYDSCFWKKYGEGPTIVHEGHFTDDLRKPYTSEDFRFTYKPGTIYAFAMRWPEDGVVHIRTLGRKARQNTGIIRRVDVLGSDGECRWKLCDDYLSVMAEGICTEAPVCIRISVE